MTTRHRFSLATLLRYRESIEHRCWLELQSANHLVCRRKNAIDELEMERREWRQGRIENLNAGMQAAGLEGWGESYYVRTRQQLRADLLEARNTAGLKLAQFSTARQQREILSNIRLHDQECFERDQARREQARVDELFLIRRSHLSRSGD